MKMALSEFALREKGIYGVLHIVILLLSLFLVVSISVDTFKGIPFYTQTVFMKVQFAVCVLFLLDFILEWFLAIPYQSIISWAGWTFSEEITYLLRFIPLVRGGYALAIVVGWLTYNKASGLFVTYLTTLLATVYFSSLAFYVMEHGVNTLVTGYGDALWWAFMDVTTVGSNIIAVTVTGRVLSVLLAALGMMMFPIFTVYVTSLLQKFNAQDKETQKP